MPLEETAVGYWSTRMKLASERAAVAAGATPHVASVLLMTLLDTVTSSTWTWWADTTQLTGITAPLTSIAACTPTAAPITADGP